MRIGRTVGSIFGPTISGDALDAYDDLILAGSNRNKNMLQLFSLSQRCLIFNIDWESNKRESESGYLYSARFSKNNPNYIFAGGAGKNEMKIFENNADGSASFRQVAGISELDSPCLSIETTRSGDVFAFGCQDGKVYICNYK